MNCNPLVKAIVLLSVIFLAAMPALGQQSDSLPSQDSEHATNPVQPDVVVSSPKEHTASDEIRVNQAVICQDVIERSPIGIADVFDKDSGKLYCFSNVIGAAAPNSLIIHNWYYQGTLQASVKLPVRSTSWRTWSTKSINPDKVGEWMVEILSGEGIPLHSIIFFVQ